MATTTNYGWTTPDDTGLVKDGASAIRTLGSSIDTTTKALNPSTTLGDIEYRSSTANTNTRLAIGSSGQGLQVVAGVPSWAASSTSTLTTTGDLLYASAANTLARRAIGTTGQVLTVSGGLPTWATPSAGGKSYSLLSTTTLSGTTTITGLGGYDDLFITISGASSNTQGDTLKVRINGSTTASHYSQFGWAAFAASTYTQADLLRENDYYQNNGLLIFAKMGGSAVETISGYFRITGANQSGVKPITYASGGSGYSGTNQSAVVGGAIYHPSTTVSSLEFLFNNSCDAGTIRIYGAV